jgi:hypothetical protein
MASKLRVFLPILSALLMPAAPAGATIVQYTDLASWTAATNTITTIGFEGLAPAGGTKDYSNTTGLVISGVQFEGFLTSSQWQLTVVDAANVSPFFNFGSGASLRGPIYDHPPANFTPYIHVVLPSMTAFSVDLMTVSPNAMSYQATLSDGSTFTIPTANRPARTFFGVTSSNPITFVDFKVLNTSPTAGTLGMLDNFAVAQADPQTPPADTPEVATLLLIGSGLIGFRVFRKRLRVLTQAHA